MIIDNMPARPFSMQTVPEETPEDWNKATQIRNWVAKTYGKPKAQVDQETTAFTKTMALAPAEDTTREKAPGV